MSANKQKKSFTYKSKFTEITGDTDNPELMQLVKTDQHKQWRWRYTKLVLGSIGGVILAIAAKLILAYFKIL